MLIKAILNGSEVGEIVTTFAGLVRNPVAFLDSSLKLVAGEPYYVGGNDCLEKGVPQLQKESFLRRPNLSGEYLTYTSVIVGSQPFRVAVQAVMIKSSIFGHLVVWEALNKFDDVDIYAIGHASTAIALDFIRRIGLEEQRQKVLGNICEDLLQGSFESEELIVKQGKALNLNLSELNLAMIIQAEVPADRLLEDLKNEKVTSVFDEFAADIRFIVEKYYPNCLVTGRRSEIAVVVAAGSRKNRMDTLESLVSDIVTTCQRELGRTEVMVGVGDFADSPKGLSESYAQASDAIAIARKLPKVNEKAFYWDMGIYRPLSHLPDNAKVRRYMEMILPGLEDCDQGILQTMEVFIECQKSLLRTGRKLYVHPNTVKYRVQKAKEIWGSSIFEDGSYIDTLVALKLAKILGVNPSRPR